MAGARRRFVTEGSGTKRHFGSAATEGSAHVTLRRLDRVVAYEPGDMVLAVQAGARLRDVQQTLAASGQWLPIDPPFSDATIGGILATHSSGPRRLLHGTIRDMLLGARILVLPGELTKSGGRVVKNVSGYDLHRLQVGAFGTLGVLVEANFKVTSLPEVSSVLLLPQPTLETAHRVLLDVRRSALGPCALEALDVMAVRALAEYVPDLPRQAALAVVGIEGSRPIAERHLNELKPIRTAARGAVYLEGPAAARVWQGFRDVPAARAREITIRVGGLPDGLPGLLAGLPPFGVERTAAQVQAAVGVARLSFSPPRDASVLAAPLDAWQRLARAQKGYVVVESAPVDLSGRGSLPWGSGREDSLGPLIKRRWDPDHILNPGKVAW
jgi:glycolate oxidase FAD binding subunit